MNKLDLEIARLRLDAWKVLDGWGVSDPTKGHRFWNWEERIKCANELLAWMLPPARPQEPPK